MQITVSVIFLDENTAFNDFIFKGFVNRIREFYTQKNCQKGNNIFWVGPVLGG